jgi:FimV-like protein
MLTRNKALKIGFILASGLCFVQQVAALDLGELVLESTLNEPLDATVELQDVSGLDPSQISVSLGTADDFAAVGIELSELASQVQFAVEVDGDAGSIHLTTPAPVEEPFLDLLLIVSWPAGMVQKDYTVLLNLAGSTPTSVGALVIPGTTNSETPAAADAASLQSDGVSGDSETYSVANGDSMWEIAARTRPSSDVSMQQMMLAIQRANEDAFINNNINRVLSGKVLRIPTLQEINLVDQDDAVLQINQQNQELSAQPLAVNRSTGNTSPAPEQDELTVLTDDQATTEAGGGGELESVIAALESERMLSEESLDRARLENTELTSRFKMLEEEMDLLQNLISAEDARIAQLQASLSTQAETAEDALATTEAATSIMAAQQSEPQPGIAGSVEGWLRNTAVLMGVIVGLLLLVLGYLFWQRRRMDAAVYAFDSGIPELETAENSTFAPAAKSGGLMGWFSGRGNKSDTRDADMNIAAHGARAVDTGTISTRGATPAQAGSSTQDPYYVDEGQLADTSDRTFAPHNIRDQNISSQTFQNEGSTASGTSSQADRTITAVDEAELADALIAEAKGIDQFKDDQADFSHPIGDQTEIEKEAQELAELVVPDVEMTDSTIPESFEFTLKTAPEALSEEADAAPEDDIESFDFQLSEPSANEPERLVTGTDKTELDASREQTDINALLLDEDETDFQAAAPMNECDTKLDLAVAYEAMGDIEGAVEILDEVIADGDKSQIAEANRLKGLWKNS